MRYTLAFLLVALLCALPILAAPAVAARNGGIQIGKRDSSATKTAPHVQRQQAKNPSHLQPRAPQASQLRRNLEARAPQASGLRRRELEARSPQASGLRRREIQPRAPQASGLRRRSEEEPKVNDKDYSSFLCPGAGVACPVIVNEVTDKSIQDLTSNLKSLADWFHIGFECVELATELKQCGGCTALGMGQDCSTMDNARATGCEKGSCVVLSCNVGFAPSEDRSECVRKQSVGEAAFGLAAAAQAALGL